MSKKREIIKITEELSEDEREKWELLTPENYERIIWNSIFTYNHRAQLDIALLLFKEYQNLSQKHPLSNPLIKNIYLRILQQFFEILDQLGFACISLINKHSKPVFETYLERNNSQTKKFFKKCAENKISETEIKKIWGIDKLSKIKSKNENLDKKMKKLYQKQVKKGKENLQKFGEIFAEYNQETKKISYSSIIDFSFAIKHDFKLINPSKITKSIWNFSNEEAAVMEKIITIQDKNGDKKDLIKIGVPAHEDKIKESLEIIIKHMQFISEEIGLISEIQHGSIDDPYYIVRLLYKNGQFKFERNEKCFCGSNIKFKKCHGC